MSRRRDRHGRGQRGPGVVPRLPGRPELRTRRERFDDLALGIVSEVDARWKHRLGPVEYAVEEIPYVAPGWEPEAVPLGAAVRGGGGKPTRVVLFRRPIEHRAENRADLEGLVMAVVVEQVAELLGVEPEEIDPRYSEEE